MAKQRTFKVHQGIDPHYLQSTLTKDITPSEALFDLVDNSVDAARRHLGSAAVDQFGLPARYDGFVIRLHIGRKSVVLVDNCGGIEERELAKHVFVTGAISRQAYGIGGFGIGLKRALFRLGTRYSLKSDTASDTATKMSFTRSDLAAVSSDLIAHRRPSLGRRTFVIAISSLGAGVEHHLVSAIDSRELGQNLSRRYGIFISKGLKIVLNGVAVPPFSPKLREDGLVPIQAANLVSDNGVVIYIDAGMHAEARLRRESDYDASVARTLADQYGWYFVCNDRIVQVATHEPSLGWKTRWHPEYYGFLGCVRFVAENPEDLPWDTKKTLIDPNSVAFRAIAERLQQFAEKFKADNKLARTFTPVESGSAGDKAPDAKPKAPFDSGGNRPSGAKQPQPTKADGQRPPVSKGNPGSHNENWNTILPDLGFQPRTTKLAALMFEAMNLSVSYPYSGAMLLRSLVECALFTALKLGKRLGEVSDAYFQEQATKNRAMSEAQKSAYRPTLSAATTWLARNHDFFPSDVRRECASALSKLINHLKELNGVVHEADLIDSGKLKIIRNDALPLIRFLLSCDATLTSPVGS